MKMNLPYIGKFMDIRQNVFEGTMEAVVEMTYETEYFSPFISTSTKPI